MTEFSKIDLDEYGQPATVRLRDEIEYGDLIIVQAHFNEDNTTISRLRSDRKPKIFQLSAKEMDKLCEAWLDYQARVTAYKAKQEASAQTMIADAFALVSSVKFDLETLNIQLDKDEDGDWRVQIPALGHKDYRRTAKDAKEMVQEALNYIHNNVIRAEQRGWINDEWKAIIASYRRVFPLSEQGESTLKVKVNLQAPESAIAALPE